MNPRIPWLAFAVSGAACLAGLALLAAAAGRHHQAEAGFLSTQAQVRHLDELRRRLPATAGDQGDGQLLARIQKALAHVGLPPGTCTGIMPRGQEALSDGSGHRRLVAVSLAGLSLADLGGWLAAFREDGATWRVTEVQCLAGGAGTALDSSRYAVSVLFSIAVPESAP